MPDNTFQFLSFDLAQHIALNFGTPIFIYDEQTLLDNTAQALGFPNAFGLTARYAMKANSNAAIVRLLVDAGMHIDASSGYEAERAMRAGVEPAKIMLTAQAPAHNLAEIITKGVHFNATCFEQLIEFGSLFPGKALGIRFNPGLGSGSTNRTNVGGPGSSFGIWHEEIERVKSIVQEYGLKVTRVHTHIGSGSDPDVWQRAASLSMDLMHHFPEADTLNLGGGYKVGRMPEESGTDLKQVGGVVKKIFQRFAEQTGRKLHLEIEPGTFMLANAGCLLAEIVSVTSTGEEGYTFYKLNTGMTEILRPSLYGAQHPLAVIQHKGQGNGTGDADAEKAEVVVVGHCCESGDILTPAEGDPEGLKPRRLVHARAGDYLVIGGAGAYCSAMAAKNYNSYPEAAEVMIVKGAPKLIRKRQTLEQLISNEVQLSEQPQQ